MANAKSVRGRDLRKMEVEWEGAVPLYTQTEGTYKDHTLVRLTTPGDLAQLGELQHHCSAAHFIISCYEKITGFLVVLTPTGAPRITYHVKQKAWLNKTHEYDQRPYMPQEVTRAVQNQGYYGYVGEKAYLEAAERLGIKLDFTKYKTSIGSTSYDRDYTREKGWETVAPVDEELRVKNAQENLDRTLEEAKKHGPLRKGHPYKDDVDYYRRTLNAAKDALKKAGDTAAWGLVGEWVNPYTPFEMDGTDWTIIGVTCKDQNYSNRKPMFVPFINWNKERGVFA